MNEEHRAYLEAIATSSDKSVKPTDRIRAIELLQEDDATARPCTRCREIAELETLDTAALVQEADRYASGRLSELLDRSDREPDSWSSVSRNRPPAMSPAVRRGLRDTLKSPGAGMAR